MKLQNLVSFEKPDTTLKKSGKLKKHEHPILELGGALFCLSDIGYDFSVFVAFSPLEISSFSFISLNLFSFTVSWTTGQRD